MKKTLLIIVLASVFPVAAQTIKFDDFLTEESPIYFFDDEITFKDRLDRFIRRLKQERSPKVYLVHYRARVTKWNPYTNSERRADQTKWEITYKTKIDPESIVVIDGGIRDTDTLEFWIGRKNSTPPNLTPTYLTSEAITCPSILLNSQGFNLRDAEPAVFSVELYPKTDSRYTWVAAGKIVEGQGSNTIKVDVNGLKKIKVAVIGDAIPNACMREATQVFELGVRAILADEFAGIPESDLRSRIDGFMSMLSENPSFTGYIVVYGKRSVRQTLASSIRLLTNHFTFRRFPKGRITVVKGGYRDRGGMELWLLPIGATIPKPRPSVDIVNLLIP